MVLRRDELWLLRPSYKVLTTAEVIHYFDACARRGDNSDPGKKGNIQNITQ